MDDVFEEHLKAHPEKRKELRKNFMEPLEMLAEHISKAVEILKED